MCTSFCKNYYTIRNNESDPISSTEARRVVEKLGIFYNEGSASTPNGRVYLVKGGVIHHNIGPQPELVIESPVREGIEIIANKFGLPL